MPILTLLRTSLPVTQQLQFVDETTFNPLPAGVVVSIYGGTTIMTSTLVATVYLIAGGYAPIAPLQTNGVYTATFVGVQAPSVSCQFVFNGYNMTVAVVYGYRSPTLSSSGYAAEMTGLWPTGPAWFGDAAKVPGGVAYAVAYGLAGQIASFDSAVQTELGRLRVQTCVGSDLDTWAADFLGHYFVRPTGATNSQWYALVLACLQIPKCTIAGIQAIVTAWIQWIAAEFGALQPLALDDSGALDTGGGYLDTPTTSAIQGYPSILVFDAQSNPTLSAALSPAVTTTSGQFVVYFRYPGYTDATISIIRPLTPLLSTIVGLWKAAGTTPVYAANA